MKIAAVRLLTLIKILIRKKNIKNFDLQKKDKEKMILVM